MVVDIFKFLFEFVIHIDKHLQEIVTNYQYWTYLILFLIIFCETGLVVTPFLPGDSLLFAAGAITALPNMPLNLIALILLLITAAFIGDNTNYFIGRFLGQKVFEKDYKLIKKKYLIQTQSFYEKHGGKTLIIARFMPIIRTFAPFVAGVGTMKYTRFYSFSIIGNILWVNIFLLGGYFFGNIDFVKKNFTVVILAIIFVSLMPPIVAFLKETIFKKKETV